MGQLPGLVQGNGQEQGRGNAALCEQLIHLRNPEGRQNPGGHCYEEGSFSLPYPAFVEALRSVVLSREVDDLRSEVGTGAAEVARIVSEVRERLDVELRPPGDPEEERYRLLQAVTDFLTNAASVQPLMVILEDLHDGDKGILEMLTHVSRHLTGGRLVMVDTYREVAFALTKLEGSCMTAAIPTSMLGSPVEPPGNAWIREGT